MFSFVKNLFKKILFSYKDFVVNKKYIDNHYIFCMDNCAHGVNSALGKGFIEANDFCNFYYINYFCKKILKKGDIFYFTNSDEIYLFLVLKITEINKLSFGDSFIQGECIRLKESINQEFIDFIKKKKN